MGKSTKETIGVKIIKAEISGSSKYPSGQSGGHGVIAASPVRHMNH